MQFFVKVMPPIKRARVHRGDCRHCRFGQGQENQDKGSGPTFWSSSFSTFDAAHEYMTNLSYNDTGACRYCQPATLATF